ncbi:MAG: FtsX-like permease family protein [Clostridiaceae bacterium]|nr:FtsX-like permease family protein [Clostridiaceae bacterium]
MSIIIKFTLKNIKEKKLRTFLILLSIILSSALFFASTAISTTVEMMIMDQVRKYIGSADIIVMAGERAKSGAISPNLLDNCPDGVKYAVGMVQGGGEYKANGETVRIGIQGIDLEDLNKMNPIILEQQNELIPFKGNKAIIGKGMAEKYGLKPGDTMGINMNGFKKWFIVSGIAQPMGPFAEDGENTYIVVPRETMAGLYGDKGKVFEIYVGLEDSSDQDMMVEELSKAYPMYRVEPTISKAMIKSETQQISGMFLIIVAFVLILSMFIIYTSFKVIMSERLPVIGTFRSIGATKKMTNRVLMAESMIYGIIGGILGDILGISILKLIIRQITPIWDSNINIKTYYTPGQLIMGFSVGLLLALISSFLPIRKVSKIPIRDIVLNSMEKKIKKKRWKSVSGVLFLIIGILGPRVVPENIAIVVDVICMFLLVPAVVLLVPIITNGILKALRSIYTILFGNEGVLASQNLKDNKNSLNNIILLGMSISVLLMITILSQSIVNDTINYYSDCKYDISFWSWPMDRSTESRLLSVEGVEDTYGEYQRYGNIQIVGKNAEIRGVLGVNKAKTLDYIALDIEGKAEKLAEELDEGRNIIVTNIFKEEFGIQKGEYLKLKTEKGILEYKVTGFIESNRFDGKFALIGERYLKSDMSVKEYSEIYIKTNIDPEEALKNIQEKFKNRNPWVRSMKQMMEENMEGNSKILGIFKGFGIMALVICVFGVFNNLIINFIDRKRSLAIMRSVGMSKRQTIKIIFIEAFTGGLIGGLIGIIIGLLLVLDVEKTIEALGGSMKDFIQISWVSLVACMVGGVAITIAASVGPALRSSKLNIIDAIKYE